jgi:hypothetical protein
VKVDSIRHKTVKEKVLPRLEKMFKEADLLIDLAISGVDERGEPALASDFATQILITCKEVAAIYITIKASMDAIGPDGEYTDKEVELKFIKMFRDWEASKCISM